VGQIESKKKQLKELQPKLHAVRRAVEDQDRYKTNLGANIDILEAQENVKVLEKEIAELEQKRDSVEGADTADDEYRAAKAKIESLKEKKARCDGLFSSHVEQIRALTVSSFCCRNVGYSLWEIAFLTIIFRSRLSLISASSTVRITRVSTSVTVSAQSSTRQPKLLLMI